MKKILSTILIALIAFSASAQFSKGLKQIGGSITAFQDQSNNEYAIGNTFSVLDERINREIGIIPRLGFFVKDNISLGFGLGFTNMFNSVQYSANGDIVFENEVKTNTIDLEFFSRFHKTVSESFYLFVEPSISASLGKAKNGLNEEIEENILGFGIGLSPGIVFMLNQKFGIEATFGSLGYEQLTRTLTEPKQDTKPKNTEKDYGLDLTLNTLRFGLQYYF